MLHPTSDMDWRFNSYMTVYMLEFPFSQIIPPSPSPSESKSPLYTSVSFFLSCIQGRHCHLPKFHIYVLVYCITQSFLTLCDLVDCSMDCSMDLMDCRLLVLHYLPELAQTHVHGVSDAIQPSHPLLSPSPPALSFSQHQGLFQ